MARSGFDIRFGYLRWLYHLQTAKPLDFAELARELRGPAEAPTLSGQTISGWAKRSKATDSRKHMRALATYFAVAEDWLIDGHGEPPRPELWRVWEAARSRPVPVMAPKLEPVPAKASDAVARRRRARDGR